MLPVEQRGWILLRLDRRYGVRDRRRGPLGAPHLKVAPLSGGALRESNPGVFFKRRGFDVPFSGDVRDREERAARNQALFRDINERIEDLNEGFGVVLPIREWICECAHDTCTERVSMTTDEYESIRKDGAQFFVAPSDEHVWADVELVVARTERYWILEKVGEAGAMAKAADPR
jgi:hypothetical protein